MVRTGKRGLQRGPDRYHQDHGDRVCVQTHALQGSNPSSLSTDQRGAGYRVIHASKTLPSIGERRQSGAAHRTSACHPRHAREPNTLRQPSLLHTDRL